MGLTLGRSLGYDPVGQVGIQVLDYVHPDDLGYALGMLTEAVRRPGRALAPGVPGACTATADWSRSRHRSPTSKTGDGFEGLLLVAASGRQPRRAARSPARARALLQEVAARCAGAVGEDVATVTDWALAQLGEFHGASSVVLARSRGRPRGDAHRPRVARARRGLRACHLSRDLALRAAVGSSRAPRSRAS